MGLKKEGSSRIWCFEKGLTTKPEDFVKWKNLKEVKTLEKKVKVKFESMKRGPIYGIYSGGSKAIVVDHQLTLINDLRNRTDGTNIFQKIASLEEVVLVHEAQYELNPTQLNRERLQKVQADLIGYLTLEEEFWKQKSGMAWFKDGDRNTRLFHAQVNGRRRRLQLKRIKNTEGNWIEGNDPMAEEEVKFFQAQFHKDIVPNDFRIIDHVPNMVTMENNQDLVRQPTKEVKHVIFGQNGDSARGPDGFTRVI
ncbi:uncharacterized protein [Nicotiana tomentosiformis]|uniref:uncharacterized protein n=1 Tax=Nicotiana tomentosiformis TaxID=4098 RepID=UPI000878BBD5|nr:uncharacterized protein LOC108946203 [Nicotiana tomentosiformis]